MDSEKKKCLLNALSRIMSDHEICREMRASQYEEWGLELLLVGDRKGALENFRASVEEKENVLRNRERDTATQDEREREDVAKKRLELARNYLGIAILEEAVKRPDEARRACETALGILAETNVADVEAQNESVAIRKETLVLLEKLA